MALADERSAAARFVRRILATSADERHLALIARHGLTAAAARRAGLLLVDEATKLLGVQPARMAQISQAIMALAAQTGDEYVWALGCQKYGDAVRAQGQNAEAVARFDEAAAAFTRLGFPVEAARTRAGWVVAQGALSGPDEALAGVRAARRVLIAHHALAQLSVLELNTGSMLVAHGRYLEALRRFTSALRLSQELGDTETVGRYRAHANRGLALTRLGRHREALAELEIARSGYLEVGEAAGYQRVLHRIGENLAALGRYAAALSAFDGVWRAMRDLGLHADAVTLALAIADCYLQLNRPAEALQTLDAAESDLAHTDNATDALGLAVRRVTAYLLLAQDARALAVEEEAQRRYPGGALQHRAWLTTQRAAIVARTGSPAEGLAAARDAVGLAAACGMRRLVSSALLTEAEALLAEGQAKEAHRTVARARRLAQIEDAAPQLHRAHELLGRIAEREGRPIAARRSYQTAIAQLEREQQGVIFAFRDSFAQDRGFAYQRLATIQLQSGSAAAALATVERAKSRALVDAIAGRITLRLRGNADTRRIARELAAAREDYAATVAQTAHAESAEAGTRTNGDRGPAALEERIAGLVQKLQLAAGLDEPADLFGAAPHADLPDLPPGGALLEFFFSGNDALRFWVDAAGVRGDILVGVLPEIERLLRSFRLNLDVCLTARPEERERLASQARAMLARLYARLFADIGDLDGLRSLVIVPHGILHYLPFHALFDGERHLIERFAISYAPSATLYGVCQARAGHRRRGALILANSAAGKLPFTLTEAEAVGAVLNSAPHTEGAATRTLLRERGRRAGLIHIAAHGRFRADAPLFSGIELADGLLTTAEVFDLDLSAALVVLSACETGLAVVGGGDELAGLVRAFLYAGAAGLLVSQWRVEDASTANLMTRFYQALVRGAEPAEALRTAQLALLAGDMPENAFTHPFFWAGFQVIGAERASKRLA